ncbi:hypothetical protein KUTeg_002308 [Tegillarca granosa]|uniref:SHSP domain-containing protein n=1 Tax=Tegillarca granosa TaxID=220873 RepID=A0ABQ9FTY6_TEGGR|nr:hypothetical protein KUTeg_002308 [Tegillarca granosa]
MSLRPRNWMMWDDPWYDLISPSRIFDQHFGLGLTDGDFEPPRLWRGMYVRPRVQQPPQHTGINNENEFKMMVDVSHFKPEEIKVKTVDKSVVITGEHEERSDEHGFIQRQFTRRFILPKDVDPNTITSSLSAEGVLTVKAPKMALEGPKERPIPIQHEPAPAVTQNENMDNHLIHGTLGQLSLDFESFLRILFI